MMKKYEITFEEVQNVVNYLAQCPYNGVWKLVEMLRGLTEIPQPDKPTDNP